MSGAGSPTADLGTTLDGTGLRVVIVAGQWHEVITDGLIAGAERVLSASGADYSVVRVPGSFELPVVSKAALDAGADAVVALGVIIRVDTHVIENGGCRTVVSRVGRQAEREVGVEGVEAVFLQPVGAQFVDESDAAALMPAQVYDHATVTLYRRQRRVELWPALAFQ